MQAIALWGIVGCVAGMCFQATNIYIDRNFDHTIDGLQVDALRQDKPLLQEVYLLQEFSNVDACSFQSAAVAINKFLALRLLVQDGDRGGKSMVDCRVEAFMHYKNAIDRLKDLYESSKIGHPAKTQAELYRVISSIFPQLHAHWNTVMSLTAAKT
jgi:hypothetical protein